MLSTSPRSPLVGDASTQANVMIMDNIHPGSKGSYRDPARLESQRALELRKFFAPVERDAESETGFNDTLNEDGALSAYAETLLWRMRGAHAMVSLIDRQEQFFLGGAMRSDDHDNDDGDDKNCVETSQWFGCSSVPTPGGLCENTLATDLNGDDYPCFIVSDLSKDERFASLPVVNGLIASYRFYAGTPITTDNGISIGSFFFFDDRPRASLSLAQRKYLYSTARNVMKHLELKREAAERRRVAMMSRGISTFLERASHEGVIGGEVFSEEDVEKSREPSPQHHFPRPPHDEFNGSKPQVSQESMTDLSRDGKVTVLDQIRSTLEHAAEILRDSLELTVGGVVFLDTTEGYTDTSSTGAYFDPGTSLGAHTEEIMLEKDSLKTSRRQSCDHPASGLSLPTTTEGSERHLLQGSIRSATDKYQAARVQAISTAEVASWTADTKVDGKTLQTFLNSYPKGNVWYIDEDGYFSSLEQVHGETRQVVRKRSSRRPIRPSNSTKQQAEAALLSRVFRKARQIIFLPLWDAGGDRWYSGCFVWSQSAVPVFTVESEISYLSAFTNSVMVEISRLDAISANRMKSDFISSISHEFRSPLHGILASADFLRESQLDSSQLEFISTIQNCGGTLLDTINHVLDYSKINSFEMKGNQQGTISSELYAVTNMALLCEDVVNGMIAAKEFRATEEGMPLSSYSQPVRLQGNNSSEVVIILDIELRDWNFKLQAGAIRRVIMNIFGNAQKYTKSGFILVDLRAMEASEDDYHKTSIGSGKRICLRIRDSGRGMSTEYIERKLYHPFAQEDSFAPGIGLGLSIVWSIVNKLGGRIHVRSELGKGTDVEVTLPLGGTEHESEGSIRSVDPLSDGEEAIRKIRTELAHKTVVILPCNDDKNSRATRHVWNCIEKYCVDWFGFKLRQYVGKEDLKTADLVIVGGDYEDCEAKRVLVVCREVSFLTQHDQSSHTYPFARIFCPIGPFKLARCILALFYQDASTESQSARSVGTQTPLDSPGEVKKLEYDFASIDEGAEENPRPQVPSSTATVVNAETLPDRQTLAGFKALTLQDIAPGFQPKLPSKQAPETKDSASQSTIAIANTSKPKRVPQSSSQGEPLNILAVDDNAINLQLLTRYLKKRKDDVISTATNGVEAVAAVRSSIDNPFDIIFMDISMPEMDGFEATRLIRAFERRFRRRPSAGDANDLLTPLPTINPPENVFFQVNGEDVPRPTKKNAYIVALTGLGSRSARDQADEYGFDGFLTKPVSFAKVGEILKQLSEQKRNIEVGTTV